MHPLTARRVLKDVKHGQVVLDPFCGSGTVLVEAIMRGARTIWVDASPLAILVAGATTSRPRRDLVDKARAVARDVLEEGKAARRSGWQAPPRRPAPEGVLRGWFEPHVRAELEALAAAVGDDQLLRAVLSSILIKLSRRASDTKDEKVQRTLARGMAARLFARRAEELAQGLTALWKAAPARTPPAELHLGDARALPLPDASVDVVATSPPYAGTYDYLDHQRLRMAFLQLPSGPLAKLEIGARRDPDVPAYARDLGKALREIARVLRPGGRAYVLIGDSLAGGRAVYADALVREVSPLPVVAAAGAERPPWGAAERAAFRRTPKREHLMCLSSSGG
jgi:SAM-dependent methyltransferase